MTWDFSLRAAFGAMKKTLPFILLRIAVYFGVAMLYIFATGAGSGVGYLVTNIGDGEGVGAGYGALAGFAGASGILYWAREYILYIVKAGHIAVLVKHYDGEPFPGDRSQLEYAKAEVQSRFAQANVLFGIDQLIKGVLKIITGTLNTVANFLPIPGLSQLTKMASAVVRMSLTYVDEIILAHLIRTHSDNPWEESRRALVLYAQNYGGMIKNAIWLSLMMWLLTLIIFLIALAPVAGIVALFPGNAGLWGAAVAFIFAWSVKSAVIEPIAIYALMQVYFKRIEGQEPNPEWEAKLENASSHFRRLKDKAVGYIKPRSSEAQQAPPSANT